MEKKAAEVVTKLTQVQKNYLVKRIDQIADSKISEIKVDYDDVRTGYEPNKYRAYKRSETQMDGKSLKAILNGDVKLKSKDDVLETCKTRSEDTTSGGRYLNALDFIDRDSLASFNNKLNDEAMSRYKEFESRTTKVRAEACSLKDKIMLEGSLAIELLKEFESKEF